jgi:hypothetical protein
MRIRLLAAFVAVCGAALAGDAEFDRVVKAIESHYGTRQTHIPLLGVADLFVKVRRPAGASEFKLAVFQDLDASRVSGDSTELDRVMTGVSGSALHPLVRVHSHHSGQATYIYASEAGHSARMLIATFGRNQATVVQVKVAVDTLLKSVADPEGVAESFGMTEDQ